MGISSRRRAGALIAVAAAVSGTALNLAPASAAVHSSTVSCGAAYAHSTTAHMADGYSFHVASVQHCPIWKAGTPVYANNQTGGSTATVGTLNSAGSGNWFVCHDSAFGRTYTYNGYTSKDWAITEDDQGSWGWVPAVFFSGSASTWTGLRECTTNEDP